jgi:hypothetical protein
MIQSVPEASGASKRHVRYSQIANDASGRGEATAPRHWPKTLAKNIGPKQTGARAVSARAPLYTRRSAPASAVEQTRGRVRSNRPAVPAAAGAASLSPPRLTPTAGASRGGQRRSPSSVLHHRLRAPPSGLSGIRGGPEPAVPARTTLNAWRRPKTGCVSLSLPTRQRLEHTELKAQTWRTVPPSLTGMGLDLVRADECPRWRRPRGSGHASPLRALLGASVSLVPPPRLSASGHASGSAHRPVRAGLSGLGHPTLRWRGVISSRCVRGFSRVRALA